MNHYSNATRAAIATYGHSVCTHAYKMSRAGFSPLTVSAASKGLKTEKQAAEAIAAGREIWCEQACFKSERHAALSATFPARLPQHPRIPRQRRPVWPFVAVALSLLALIVAGVCV